MRYLLTFMLMLVVASPAFGSATRSQANLRARRAADSYTNRNFGIGGLGFRDWRAGCTRLTYGWACVVNMNGGQCTGTLKLTGALRPYAYKIGCGE